MTTSNNNNNRNHTPIGSLREYVPAGISHVDKDDPAEAEPTTSVLPPWQRVQIARHPERPHALDYISRLCDDFVEMHGDRLYGDDAAIVGGLAQFEGQTVMLLGEQ